jgi:trk system potassium uptake protein TrkH
VLSLLILLGGIGFPVLDELGRAALTKLRRRRLRALDLHTRVVLRTSALLVVVMAVAYTALEWRASFAPLPWYERIMAAVFQSISSRTAGFSVIDLSAMTPAALVLTCAAMFIGASPGSTGGGIKTSTLAALFAGLRAELGASAPTLLDRTLPPSVIRKAIGVAVLSMSIVFFVIVTMLVIEDHPPLSLVFEVVSAFSTTGLSTGITPELSVAGKLVITLTMFVGRIGPLTLALALSLDQRAEPLELPAERVMVG